MPQLVFWKKQMPLRAQALSSERVDEAQSNSRGGDGRIGQLRDFGVDRNRELLMTTSPNEQ